MLIFHMDMDAFYASVEQRDYPEYRNKPVIVGGRARRGVVATCSYEARRFGVHSAQPIAIALKKCPDAIVVTPRMSHYVAISRQIMALLEDYSGAIEPLSLDEAFLDMSDLVEDPLAVAHSLKNRVFDDTQLTCSIGIGPNKFLAKFASDLQKPNGITRVPQGHEAEFLANYPVRKLWGVGPKTEDRIRSAGLETIGDIAAKDISWLRIELGRKLADHLWELAHGIDHRSINPDRERKSIGSEHTFEHDLKTRDEVAVSLIPHADEVAATLRRKQLRARGVRIKIRYTDGFCLQTRQSTLPAPTDDAQELLVYGRQLLDGLEFGKAIRLVGLAVYDLVGQDVPQQLGLFQSSKRPAIGRAIDAISARFGEEAIKRGSHVKPDESKSP